VGQVGNLRPIGNRPFFGCRPAIFSYLRLFRVDIRFKIVYYPAVANIPSDAEFGILTVLWRCGPSTVREVHEALAKDTGYTSTLKQMQVMHEKGLLLRSERYRSHLYEAAITREEAQARFAGDLMHRVFEGSARNLVLGALTAQRASAEDLDEIRCMFDKFEKRRKSR
jgi:BlaI family transcriptional regulator, penicillinase repressor